jgi:hypothetical protein
VAEEVHTTQLPVLGLQIGVSPEQCASSVQSTQVPWDAPLVLQRPERQTLPASAAVHGPMPLAKPHSSSRVSHTPLTQTKVAAASLQMPSSVGLEWGASLGSGVPFPSCGKQAPMATLHHLPPVQSASTLQPVAGWHSPFVLQAAERHTTPPLAIVHGPWPAAKPHRLSALSQTPLWQTKVAAGTVQLPSSVGVMCGGSVGSGLPLASVGWQVREPCWHQFPVAQSVSKLQPPAERHLPSLPHSPERHTTAPLADVQVP